MSLWRGVWKTSRATRRSLEAAVADAAAAAPNARGMRHRVFGDEEPRRAPEQDRDRGDAQDCGDRGPPVNLARLLDEKIRKRERFCSYELFPTKSRRVYRRFFSETQACEPAFYALTWHEEAATAEERFPSLTSAENFPGNTLLHCTAKGLKRTDVEKILIRALELGIVNVFALQGDSGSDDGDFTHASDLVTFIRERFGQQFSICVAGYPEMHPHSSSKDQDLFHLKAKVDAGADFIITQFFFESQVYIQFVNDCRKLGITVPIIPGIYPFTNENLLLKMIEICHTNVPPWIQDSLHKLKDDDEGVRKLGIDLSVKIIKEIMECGIFFGYHLYTLNRSLSAVEVHRQLNVQKQINELVSNRQ